MTAADLKLRSRSLVEYYGDRWRNLRAWSAPLPMAIEIKPHRGTYVLGTAWSALGKAEVKVTGRVSRDLATLLHEMAHLAAPDDEHHGIVWKTMFARAAAEAFGCEVDDFELDVTKYDMDKQVIDMCEVWLAELGGA